MRLRVTADAHMLRAKCTRDESAHCEAATLKMKGEKRTFFSQLMVTSAIKDGAERIV